MKFNFGFKSSSHPAVDPTKPDSSVVPTVQSNGDERKSRRADWISECMQRTLDNGFPDGGLAIEGGLFIRNDDEGETQITTIQTTSTDSSVIEIKKPVSKRLQNWLNFFYPLSPPKKDNHGIASISPASSTAGSDVDYYPINHRFSPSPKPAKSILKKSKERDLLTLAEESTGAGYDARRKILFSETTILVETFSKEEYNRTAIDYVARSLTPTIAMLIKKELNEVKQEMEVHERSKHHTQFYQVK